MTKRILTIILGLFISTQSFSQTWTYVGKNAKSELYFIKKHSETYGSTKVWIKHISKITEYYKRGKTYIVNGYTLTLYETDCTDRKLNLRTVNTYKSDGTFVDTYSKEEYQNDWTEVVPDSIGEMFLEKACEILQ